VIRHTLSPQMPRERYYAFLADQAERDPVNGPDANGRATVPMGRGFAMWRRFNPDAEVICVTDIDGRDRTLTRKQADVLDLALTFVDRGTVTVRALAADLKCAPSTVSRALARLASFGLLAYLGGRGRYAGMVIFRRVKGDPFKRFQDEAKARLARYRKTAEDRISRLALNVASMYSMRNRDSDRSHGVLVQVHSGRAQHWTVGAPVQVQPPFFPEMGDGLDY
jgi:hypothetical protein